MKFYSNSCKLFVLCFVLFNVFDRFWISGFGGRWYFGADGMFFSINPFLIYMYILQKTYEDVKVMIVFIKKDVEFNNGTAFGIFMIFQVYISSVKLRL